MNMESILTFITSIIAIITSIIGISVIFIKIGKYSQKIDDMEKRFNKSENELNEIYRKLIEINTKLEERTSNNVLLKRKTPLSLTEKGKELLKKSGAELFVLKNQDILISAIKNKNPKTAYDIQEISKDVLNFLLNDDLFIPLKEYAFNEGLDINDIITVASICLRDIALPLLGFRYIDLDKTTSK